MSGQAYQVVLTPSTSVSRSPSGARHPRSPLRLTTIASPLKRRGPRSRSQACEAKRTQANKVKLCLKTGATGHDEGSESVIRSFPRLHTGTAFEQAQLDRFHGR